MIPVAKPCWGVEEETAVLRVMRSGRVVQGAEVEAFEQAVAEFVGVKYAVATSSGTTALHTVLLALDIGRGDDVMVPAFTFVATANTVLACGAKVLLCDIELATFNAAKDAVWDLPGAPLYDIAVHCFGVPSLAVVPDSIEDAACALGSFTLRGHAATLSFHATKVITTGEGGMVVTNDPDVAKDCRFLRDQKHGQGLAYNYRMTEIQGAIGREQMKRLPWILERRKVVAALYDAAFDGQIRARIPPRGGNYQSYVLLLHEELDRAVAIQELAQRGVEALMGTQFLGDMPHLKTPSLPNARYAGSHAMRIPMFPQLTDEEVGLVINAVQEVLGA